LATDIQAVIFDLDGTLIDSAPDMADALNRLLADEGRDALDVAQVIAMIGWGSAKLVESAFQATGPAAAPEDLPALIQGFLDHYQTGEGVSTEIYPGVRQALGALRDAGVKLGLCTNKPQLPAEELLATLELKSFFPVIVGGDPAIPRKPDPTPLLAVLERLGVAPEHAVMVGDSANDINCAHAAGVRSIAVTYGYVHGLPEALGADRLIGHFEELPARLAELGG
jgi:phosphoglycolate phosphatase